MSTNIIKYKKYLKYKNKFLNIKNIFLNYYQKGGIYLPQNCIENNVFVHDMVLNFIVFLAEKLDSEENESIKSKRLEYLKISKSKKLELDSKKLELDSKKLELDSKRLEYLKISKSKKSELDSKKLELDSKKSELTNLVSEYHKLNDEYSNQYHDGINSFDRRNINEYIQYINHKLPNINTSYEELAKYFICNILTPNNFENFIKKYLKKNMDDVQNCGKKYTNMTDLEVHTLMEIPLRLNVNSWTYQKDITRQTDWERVKTISKKINDTKKHNEKIDDIFNIYAISLDIIENKYKYMMYYKYVIVCIISLIINALNRDKYTKLIKKLDNCIYNYKSKFYLFNYSCVLSDIEKEILDNMPFTNNIDYIFNYIIKYINDKYFINNNYFINNKDKFNKYFDEFKKINES